MSTVTTKKELSGKQAVQFINSRTSVNEAGKYALQVISANHYQGRVILGLKAQSPTGLAQAQEALRAKAYSDAANTNMSTSVFADAAFIPSKGEHVSCMVDYVENRKGEMVLGVVSVSEIKAKTASKVSLGDEFANLLDDEDESTGSSTSLD